MFSVYFIFPVFKANQLFLLEIKGYLRYKSIFCHKVARDV